MKISLIKNKDIDFEKWDQCIYSAHNSLIYAYSWFLNVVSPGWDAVVVNDYQVVMPLTTNRKFGFTYLRQPMFTQQLGLFSTESISEEITDNFIKLLFAKFKLVEICLNTSNVFASLPGFVERKTFVLDLNKSYDELFNQYSVSCKKNLRRAGRNNLEIQQSTNIEDFIQFKTVNKVKAITASDSDFQMLKRVLESCNANCNVEILNVMDTNSVHASACFVEHQGHVVYYSASTPEAKNNKAMFFLLDHFIKTHAGKPLKLDFVGSNIPSIAYFFAGFGSEPVVYPGIRVNKLPWFIKLLK